MLRRTLTFFFLMLAAGCPAALANNLTLSNVSLEDPDSGGDTVQVEFDIRWDNSWRLDNSEPNNYDAVWIFFKACKGAAAACSPTANVAWSHVMLATAGENPSDTDSGSNSDLNIDVPDDRVGAFLYRKTEGAGTMASNNVRLTLKYSEAPLSAGDTDDIQVTVYGIEMVYIPEGDFYIGDGDGTNESHFAFHSGTSDSAVQITSALASTVSVDTAPYDDAALDTTGIGIDGDGGLDTDNNGSIDNAFFPTGYMPYYMTKYEIANGQYRDFLNSLTQAAQDSRVYMTLSSENSAYKFVSGSSDVSYRTLLKAGSNPADGYPYEFGCDLNDNDVFEEYDDGECVVYSKLYWMDFCAYADWAGLRPPSELEYEKACRGPLPAVYGEYAYGNTSYVQAGDPINGGQVSETSVNSSAGLVNCDYSLGSDPDNGPLRAGFAATAGTTRVTAAAGYYGIMELTGNVEEFTVSLGRSQGRGFQGTHGDGILTTTASYEGNATNTDWPGIDATASRGVTSATGAGSRGGQWILAPKAVSNRINASTGIPNFNYGGHLVRTAGFWCGSNFTVFHDDVRGVAPVDAKINYGTVSTNLTGEDKCWITRNLGATQQATSATDNTAASAGWYWQFNRKQGYSHDGTTLTPSWTITSIDETSDWTSAEDPCTIELGAGWRLPTYTEWSNADSNGSWGSYNDTYSSVLKIHAAGFLHRASGSLDDRGSYGAYGCSTQYSSIYGYYLGFGDASSSMLYGFKTLGFSVRCLKD